MGKKTQISGLLRYVGPAPADVGVVPLPEGWPAATHEETDVALLAEKLASGMYEPAVSEAPGEPAPAAPAEE